MATKMTKAACLDGGCLTAEEALPLINRFSRTELKAENVYLFSLKLCDNEIDRDNERFSEATIGELSDLFLGRTGISDHEWSASRQIARIFRTEVVTEKGRKTSLGKPYQYLRAWAYMLKNEATQTLIDEIEGGIKREVSIGCAVAERICSICGEEIGSAKCSHIPGRSYEGKRCYSELKNAVDAYEWSFVAVPAQREAGVIKRFGAEKNEAADETLRYLASLGEKHLQTLRQEIRKLSLLLSPQTGETVETFLQSADESSLCSLKKSLEAQVDRLYPPVTQLPGKKKMTRFCNEADYKI